MPRIILNFHGLGAPHAAVPVEERPFWLTADRFCRIAERIAAHRSNGHDIDVTFDDGNRADLTIAMPILRQLDIPASYFVLTGRLGLAEYLGADDIRELAASGFGIGLHGQDHVDWRTISSRDLETETVTARSRLAEIVGAPITAVSIPFGAYNRRVLAYLRKLAFTEIYTSDRGVAGRRSPVLARNTIRSDMTEDQIENIILGREPIRTRLRRSVGMVARRWLI